MLSIRLKVGDGFWEPYLHFARSETHMPGPVNTWHRHAVYHIVYVAGGTGMFHLDDQRVPVEPGMLVFVNPNEWHQFFAGHSDPFRYDVVSFQLLSENGEPCVHDMSQLFGEAHRQRMQAFMRRRSVRIPRSIEGDLNDAFREMFSTVQKGDRLVQERARLQMISFLVTLGELLQEVVPAEKEAGVAETLPKPGYRRQIVERALQYMNAHFDRPLMLGEIARHVHLHPVYFSQLFKEEIGLPPRRCLLKIRLNHARKLLNETNRSIGDIADQCGFRSVTYFSRAFRAAEGVSPSAYRRLGEQLYCRPPLAAQEA